jgi:hypothetical protein
MPRRVEDVNRVGVTSLERGAEAVIDEKCKGIGRIRFGSGNERGAAVT